MARTDDRPLIPNTTLRRVRCERGFSQDDLAAALRDAGVLSASKRNVQRWEAGEVTWPQAIYRRGLRVVLGKDASELGFHDPEDPMHRRNALAAAAGIAAAALTSEPFTRLEYALNHRPSAITAADAEVMLQAANGLYAREATETAESLTPDLTRHLDMIAALLSVGSMPEAIRRTLILAAGTTAVLGGWICHDQDQLEGARGYWQAAISAAKAAGEGPLLACALTYQSYVYSARGEHRAAWQLLEQAAGHVRSRSDARSRAWVTARQAEEAAAMGEHGPALVRLSQAMTALDYADPDEPRPWAKFFDAARLGSMGVAVYGAMQHPQLQPAADAVMDSLGPDRLKTRAVILGDIAQARVLAGDLDAGCALARQALTATVEGEAMLGYQRLRALRPRLDEHQDAAPVRELLPEFDAAGITTKNA